MNKSAAQAMTYTYTVRPMAEKLFHPDGCSYEITGAGAVVTIREQHTGKVVQQFPRCDSEAAGHRLAQFHIKLLKGMK